MAKGEIQVQKAAPDSLGLNSALGIQEGGEDSLLVNIDLQTQMNLLQSKTLALQVVDELHLEGTPDFKGHFNPIGFVMGMFTPKGRPDTKGAPLADRPNRREGVLGTFAHNLKVEPVPGTRLIDISYMSQDPKTAAAVVNRLVQDLITLSSKSQQASGAGSSQWMEDQLSSIREETERKQQEVARIQQQAGIVALGTTDTAGRQQTYSTILDQLQQTSTTLGAAQTNRILKQAMYEAAKSGNPELISGISPNLTASAPGLSTSLNLIQNLRVEEAAEQVNLAQMEAKFGSAYPKLQETRMRIARFEQEIHDEAGRILERSRNDYIIAVQAEQSTRAAYDKEKKEADAVNNSAMRLAIASEEAESSRKLYEDLLSRSKEAQVLEGLRSSGISVTDPAMTPGRPAKPKVVIYLAAAIFLGLSLGAGFVILMDVLSGRVVSIAALKHDFGISHVAVLPLLDEQETIAIGQPSHDLTSPPALAISKLPLSSYSEGIRSMGFSLFSARKLSHPRVVMVTSSLEGEGKTTLAANLAVFFAQQGNRVLLVDSDFRHPEVQNIFGIANEIGLSNILSSDKTKALPEVQTISSQERLSVLVAGSGIYSPSELLGSPRLGEVITQYRENFDLVILDSAPLLPVSDAILVAAHADQVLLVARLGEIRTTALQDAIAKLEHYVFPESITLVANGVDRYAHNIPSYSVRN
jgi:capsular exopolysaccharide synthesis family protein